MILWQKWILWINVLLLLMRVWKNEVNVEWRHQTYARHGCLSLKRIRGFNQIRYDKLSDVYLCDPDSQLPPLHSAPISDTFQVPAVAATKITVFWNVTSCSTAETDRSFARKVSQSSVYSNLCPLACSLPFL